MLAQEDQGFPEFSLTNGTDVASLATLLIGCTDPVVLRGTEDLQGLPHTSQPAADVKRFAETVQNEEDSSEEIAAGWIVPHDVLVPQLDRDQGAEELAHLFNDQVELPLRFDSKDEFWQGHNQALQGNGEVFEDEVGDPDNPHQIEKVQLLEVGLQEDEEYEHSTTGEN